MILFNIQEQIQLVEQKDKSELIFFIDKHSKKINICIIIKIEKEILYNLQHLSTLRF